MLFCARGFLIFFVFSVCVFSITSYVSNNNDSDNILGQIRAKCRQFSIFFIFFFAVFKSSRLILLIIESLILIQNPRYIKFDPIYTKSGQHFASLTPVLCDKRELSSPGMSNLAYKLSQIGPKWDKSGTF